MKEFRIDFTIIIDDRKKMICARHKGISLEQVAEIVQSDLMESGWITDTNGRYYRSNYVTDFEIYEISSEEQNQ